MSAHNSELRNKKFMLEGEKKLKENHIGFRITKICEILKSFNRYVSFKHYYFISEECACIHFFHSWTVRAERILSRWGSEIFFNLGEDLNQLIPNIIIVFFIKFPKFRWGLILRISPVPPSLDIPVSLLEKNCMTIFHFSDSGQDWG